MTTYTTIADADIDQDSPVTQPLMTALRDNPIAIGEGAAGAPRIYGAAMHGPAAGAVAQRDCLPTGSRSASAAASTTASAIIEAASFTALVACTVRVSVTFTTSGLVASRSVVVYKNGAAAQTWTSDGSYTVDVTLAAGDAVGVVLSVTASSGGTGTITCSALEHNFAERSAVMT